MGEPKNNKLEDEKKNDTASEEGVESSSDKEEKDNPFSNLDLREWYCFGIEHPKYNSWVYNSLKSRTEGWNHIDVQALEHSLKVNVDASYLQLASFYLVNLDDEVKWHCWFDNINYLWNLEITNSPKAEIEIETKQNFFSSDIFKKIALRTSEILERAMNEYHNIIEYHLKEGELINVDEVKLNTIIYLLDQKMTIENIRNGKWKK